MCGKWISIDGCEGCGKTTLVNSLKEKYPNFVYVPEFSTSFVGQSLYNAVKNEPYIISKSIIGASLLFLSDYFHLVETLISPSIEKGCIVISDRGFASKIAVQSAVMTQYYEEQCVRDALEKIFKLSIVPDITIVIDTPIDLIKSRLLNRDGKYDEERERLILSSKRELDYYIKRFNLKYSKIHTIEELDNFVLSIGQFV